MHDIQKKIYDLASRMDLGKMTLRAIADEIKEDSKQPQKIKHHLGRLIDLGFLVEDKKNSTITLATQKSGVSLVSLPVYGLANCGRAASFAEDHVDSYIQLSQSVIRNYPKDDLFVVRAVGDSMNRALVDGKYIEDGDYVIINHKPQTNYENKYVLSIIGGMANIKKLRVDKADNQIHLLSVSTQDYPPIVIDASDADQYSIAGEVVKVIKN